MKDLKEIGKRLGKMLGDAATGPLIIARDVLDLNDNWDERPEPFPQSNGSAAVALEHEQSLREQAGGVTCDAWVRRELAAGGVAYFAERQKAVQMLGEASRRTIHHQVAVHLLHKDFAPMQLEKAKLELMRGARSRNGNPLSFAQGLAIIRKIAGHVNKPRCCERCALLEKMLIENGVEVPE